jgi:phosphohistidine phosphatase SixA
VCSNDDGLSFTREKEAGRASAQGNGLEEVVPAVTDPQRRLLARVSIYALASTVMVVGVWWWCPYVNRTTTILLVRHAEKAGEGNSDLTDAGRNRADELVTVAADAGVTAIYATEWCRTVLTSKPIAEARGLTVQIVRDAAGGLTSCTPSIPASRYSLLPVEIDTPAEVVGHVLANHPGGTALIVGHSNTVPELIRLLSGGFVVSVPDHAFDRLFILTRRDFGPSRLVKGRYGAFSCNDGMPAACPS